MAERAYLDRSTCTQSKRLDVLVQHLQSINFPFFDAAPTSLQIGKTERFYDWHSSTQETCGKLLLTPSLSSKDFFRLNGSSLLFERAWQCPAGHSKDNLEPNAFFFGEMISADRLMLLLRLFTAMLCPDCGKVNFLLTSLVVYKHVSLGVGLFGV